MQTPSNRSSDIANTAGTENNQQGKIIAVFSPRGGVGKTGIAVNLAIALADRTGTKVALVDADLQFGDVGFVLNLVPKVTIADMMRDINHLDETVLADYMLNYNANLDVLAAPIRPEQAELIDNHSLSLILQSLRQKFQYTVIDTASAINSTELTVLDIADYILLVTMPDMASIKNTKLALALMKKLGYDDEKVMVVLNGDKHEFGIKADDIEESLQIKFIARLPFEPQSTNQAINDGAPFIVTDGKTPLAGAMNYLASMFGSVGKIDDNNYNYAKITDKLRLFWSNITRKRSK